jgi:hypothetical protein
MQWYVVKKHINGHYYWYWQKTYREGRYVRTLNKYIGPVDRVPRPASYAQPIIRGDPVELPATTIPMQFPRPVRARIDQRAVDFTIDALRRDVAQTDFDQAWQVSSGKRNTEILAKSFPKVDALLSTLEVNIMNVSEQGNWFDPRRDYINIINKQWWYVTKGNSDIYRYYRTVCHELIHWTGHRSRLNRIGSTTFGSKEYALEELTAEMGSLMLLKVLGYNENETTEYHASYFQSWLQRMPDQEQAISLAKNRAKKAVEYILEHGGVL